MIVGLTGPSGAGKSTVASLFVAAGFRHIDCDAMVHALGETSVYAAAVENAFGAEYVRDGRVERRTLAALVFGDPAKLARLNDAVSPLIASHIAQVLAEVRQSGEWAVLDAPLLFEYGLERECDLTVGVIAEKEILLQRLCARDDKPETELRGRLAAQHGGDYFRARCDYILENNTDRSALETAFAALLAKIRKI